MAKKAKTTKTAARQPATDEPKNAESEQEGPPPLVRLVVEKVDSIEYAVKVTIPPGPEMTAPARMAGDLSDEKKTCVFGRALEELGKSYQHWGLQADAVRAAEEAEAQEKKRWA